MQQAQFVIPAELTKDAVTITANGTAADVVLNKDASLVTVESVGGQTLVRLLGTCADSDGAWDVVIPEGKDKAFTVTKETTLSVIGGGEVRITSYA